MSKSNGHFFGRSNRGGMTTVIETPVSRSYRRKAKVAFFVTAGVVGLLSATVISHYTHPILGLVAGAFIGVAAGLLVGAFVTAWPVLRVFWHWSIEIVLATAIVSGWITLMQATPIVVSALIVAVVIGVPASVGPVRRRIVAWTWCLIVRHRLRLCFAAFIASNRNGSLPLILAARPTPAGERVWIWLRPGLALHDLEADGQVQKLAVACWANEVRVVRTPNRRAALLRIDITRREPLAATVISPLPGLVPDPTPANAPVSPGMPPVGGLDLPDVPDDHTSAFSDAAPRRKSRNPADTPQTSHDANYDYA